jgi:hypothetical protein
MTGSIACAGPTARSSREEPVSNRRLRACLTAAATAAVLTACGGDDAARTNHLGYEDGVAPAEGLTFLEGLAIYLLAPAAILLLIAALVWLPGMVRSSRYRPGRGWKAAPLWFGGPPDPAAAVESASTGDLVRGGASGDW